MEKYRIVEFPSGLYKVQKLQNLWIFKRWRYLSKIVIKGTYFYTEDFEFSCIEVAEIFIRKISKKSRVVKEIEIQEGGKNE